jgi:hypothetical protein
MVMDEQEIVEEIQTLEYLNKALHYQIFMNDNRLKELDKMLAKNIEEKNNGKNNN